MSDSDDEDRELMQINENVNYKSISCENIPEIFLDKLVAKKHFSKFGRINKFILRPSRLSCQVDYETEPQAELAFLKGGFFNDFEFEVRFTELEESHIQNTEEWVDPDVQAELDSMRNLPNRMAQRLQNTISKPPPMSPNVIQPPIILPPIAPSSKTIVKPVPKSQFKSADDQVRIDPTVKAELETVLSRPANSTEDRFQILDARDKLIRLTTARTTDIRKVVSIKGTCPDMCPEKERLMRETRNQVSVFEFDQSGGMDYKIAIKEYSRSSADQEIPLAHELRPESVLKMTMSYLLHKIMDLCENEQINLGDWYHFVWDRTRSIRKDITQQELCSLESVKLVEQCARFHIHCAARLVAEDASVFDPRINTENLTKSLQTLKYMYHDLRLKGIKCSKEPEFRAYIILLNLNDANFLWEINQLPDEIQKSNEVLESIEFYLALQSNNYVKFFKLIEKTTYMNACILLRYFHQVRVRALQAIMKAYNWPRQAIFIPLNYMKTILAFETDEDAILFFNFYGLECFDNKVKIDKNSFFTPDDKWSEMDRSIMIVEVKRNVSIGEAICGDVLESIESFENHEPHCSFDGSGFLKLKAWSAGDQSRDSSAIQDEIIDITKKPKVNVNISDDLSLFKVPNASPPISAKQHQQKTANTGPFKFAPSEFKNSNASPTDSLQTSKSKTEFKAPSSKSSVLNKNPDIGSIFQKNKTGAFPFQQMKQPSTVGTNQQSKNIFQINTSKISSGNIFPQQTKKILSKNDIQTSSKDRPDGLFETQSTELPNKENNLNSKTHKKFFDSSKVFGTHPKENVIATGQSIKNDSKAKSNNKFLDISKKIGTANDDESNSIEKDNTSSLPTFTLLKNQSFESDLKSSSEDGVEEVRRRKMLEKNLQIKQQLDDQKKQEAADRDEKNIKIKSISSKILDELIKEFQLEEIKGLVIKELEMFQELKKYREKLTNDILEEVLYEMIQEIIIDESEVLLRNHRILQKYFYLWQQKVQKKLHRRQLIESVPFWAQNEKIVNYASKIAHPNNKETLQEIKRYRLGVSKTFNLNLKINTKKIDLFKIFNEEILKNEGFSQQRKLGNYLKIIISIPNEFEEIEGFESYFNKILLNSIKGARSACNTFLCEAKNNLALCLRRMSGIVPKNEQGEHIKNECDFANGLVFVMTSTKLEKSKRRLHYLLKLSLLVNKPIPIAILIYKPEVKISITEDLKLDQILDDLNLIKIFKCSDNTVTDGLSDCFRFLGQSLNTTNDLEMQNYLTFLQYLTEIWKRFHDSWKINPAFQKFCSNPNNVILLYNDTIWRLCEIVEEDFYDFVEFPEELREFVPKNVLDIPLGFEYFPKDWKSRSRTLKLGNFLRKIKLKQWKNDFSRDIQTLEKELLQFAVENLPQCEKTAHIAGYSAIKALLDNLSSIIYNDIELKDKLNNISWLEVIREIALQLLKYTWKTEKDNLPMEIIYKKSSLKIFTNTPWWLELKNVKEIKFNSIIEIEMPSDLDENDEFKIDCIMDKANDMIEKADRILSDYRGLSTEMTNISKNLDLSFYNYEKSEIENKLNLNKNLLRNRLPVKEFSDNIMKRKRTIKEAQCADEDDDVENVIAKAMKILDKVEKRIGNQNKETIIH